MTVFKKGQTIEVGIGDTIHDEDGHSKYILIDVELITENEVEKLFPIENVLYVDTVTDQQSIKWGKENLLSHYLK